MGLLEEDGNERELVCDLGPVLQHGDAEEEGHGPDQAQRLLRVRDRPDRLRGHREHNSQVPGYEHI